MSKYKGRVIDDVALWEGYVDFPPNMRVDPGEIYLPKVQCPNPAHDTLKRHFQINTQDGLVHCFTYCGIQGSYEHAIAVIEGLYERFKVDLEIVQRAWGKKSHARSAEEREHLRRAARAKRFAGKIILKNSRQASRNENRRVQAPKKGLARATKPVQSRELEFQSFLPAVAIEYLGSRGISDRSVARWNLGWHPEQKRVVIPAHDENGILRFLIQRAVLPKQQPKYLYTEGFPKTSLLFGAGQIDLGMVHLDGLALVEGSLDTIVLHQHDLRITTGILGTGISDEQCRIIARIRPKRILLWFDKDSAGVVNIEIASAKLKKYPLFVVRYPKGKSDPGELTKEEAHRQKGRAVPISRFLRSNGLSVKSRKEFHVG